MKACRRDLEATLGLEPKALDVHKKLIERRVLSVCFSARFCEERQASDRLLCHVQR